MSPPTTGGTTTQNSFFTFLKTITNKILPSSNNEKKIGDVWSGIKASEAYEDGTIFSQSQGGRRLRVAFRNLSSVPLMLCFVSDSGTLQHFYRISPSTTPTTANDDVMVTITDKIENTVRGHSFCWIYVKDEEEFIKAKETKKLNEATSKIIGGYRACCDSDDKSEFHLVTICQEKNKELICCSTNNKAASGGLLRKRKIDQEEEKEVENDDDDDIPNNWIVRATIARVDPTPVPVKGKDKYEKKVMGGWPVYCEPDWYRGDKKLEKRLESDLAAAYKALPPHARDFLTKNCPIWINRTIKFGPAACPVSAGAPCCYHPDKNWLIEHGLCEHKAQCVEVNDGYRYSKDVELWGYGGVMIHELSHAYHHSYMPDGYNNKEINDCYEAAMRNSWYHRVKVHGPQGPYAKAYACENCMEYFAELSAAFLGGLDDSVEFNKWFPFNRKQIKEYDPKGYDMLCRVWKVKDDDDVHDEAEA